MARSVRKEYGSQELLQHGLRVTRQRIAVLHFLRRARSHPSALAVHRAIIRVLPRVGLKTVYEILHSLVAAGLASVFVDASASHRYEARTDPHDHAHCRVCDRLFDLSGSRAPDLSSRRDLPAGFRIETTSVTFRGVCGRCRRNGQQKN